MHCHVWTIISGKEWSLETHWTPSSPFLPPPPSLPLHLSSSLTSTHLSSPFLLPHLFLLNPFLPPSTLHPLPLPVLPQSSFLLSHLHLFLTLLPSTPSPIPSSPPLTYTPPGTLKTLQLLCKAAEKWVGGNHAATASPLLKLTLHTLYTLLVLISEYWWIRLFTCLLCLFV